MDRKPFFNAACVLAEGKLTQTQVDDLNKVADALNPDQVMAISQVGIDLITSFEDLRLTAYDDGVGVWAIGYGTTIYPNGGKVKRGDVRTKAQAVSFFQHDLRHFEAVVNRAVKVGLNQRSINFLSSMLL